MEGEFDREIDDGGWGPGMGAWRPLELQLENTLKAAGAVVPKKGKDRKLADMKGQVERLVKYRGKKMSDPGPLGAWLWAKEKNVR